MESRFKIDFPCLRRIKVFRDISGPCIIKVTHKSPLILRQSLLLCAKYFQREGYSDMLHYNLDEKNFVGYLFTEPNRFHAVGGCIFRFREYNNIPEKFWTMHWIWMHPYIRNKGLLSKYVDKFNKEFGYWYPEHPLSKAMQRFVIKHKFVNPSEKFKK